MLKANPDDATVAISNWIVQQGIDGTSPEALMEGYCARLIAAGVPMFRLHIAHRAYHPQFGAIGFNWWRDKGAGREEYGRAAEPGEQWLRSPFRHMLASSLREIRICLVEQDTAGQFPLLDDFRSRGATDYFATNVTFGQPDEDEPVDPDDPPEGLLISLLSDAPDGFSDTNLKLLRSLTPTLGLALKSASNRQMASDVVGTYLGADAGARVLSGEIQRGSVERIDAVIWFLDLQGFTKLSEQIEGVAMIDMLNAYFGEAVAAIEHQGGNVLKFMGDGLLAIFDKRGSSKAVDQAVEAAVELRGAVDRLNAERTIAELPITNFTLALHEGEVLYGNIGGEARLDFTVIGPAVNAAARIQGMCGQLDRRLILSTPVARAVERRADELVSLGRYLLRGVKGPQELYTLYRGDDDT
ncbi:MAG: adenylate/guanylate cyclase domain-containing protein [Pseudomonadota bacterium]